MVESPEATSTLAPLAALAAEARATHDPDVEAALVQRRFEIGREILERHAGDPRRVPSPVEAGVADPFPEVRARPPELSLAELDVDVLRGALAHHGCLLVHDFFPDETMQVLRDDVDRMAIGFDRWMASGQREETPSWWVPFAAPGAELPLALRSMCGPIGTFYAADSPRALLHLVDAFDAAGLPELLASYMDEPVLLGLEKTSLRRVPPAVPNAWHQDGLRFGVDAGLVNLWVSLCECGPGVAPTLAVLPKRMGEILPLNAESPVPWDISPAVVEAAGEGIAPVELTLRPGDALMFDEMLVHSTRTDPAMTHPRYCADAWFFPRSGFPADLYKPLAYALP